MPYFNEHYNKVRFPQGSQHAPGFRKAQIGAIFAVGSHFTVSKEPAVVVMPTGSGKTAVLISIPYVRRSARVLVMTTSRLVRNQIAEEVESLRTLKDAKALPEDLAAPSVHELKTRITSVAEWQSLKEFDVVVATPTCVSPAVEGIPPPPKDLFDIVLVDEAHHAPAKTWRAVLDAFPETDKVLFTATPYRRDGREVKGKLVYAYPLKAAFEDQIFGRIRFVPVKPAAKENNDIAIAKATGATFSVDRDHGLVHYVMVRTDSKARADELKEIYEKNTNLRLRVIHSGLTYRTIKKAIQELREGKLDGVICVDMMSEGFDLPNLKIAAIHAPHKSLAVTLQFIGRFARTNAKNIGEAKFLAVPQEIEGEIGRLFDENPVWQDLVTELSGERLLTEENVRQAIESFAPPVVADFETAAVSLYALRPFKHVKIYRITEEVDISSTVRLPRPFDVVHHRVSEERSTAVIIANEQQRPRWTDLEIFNRSEFDLFVIFYHKASKLLFINASRRSDALYEEIAKQYTGGKHKILSLSRVNRVLRGLGDPEFFNVGMRNRVLNSNTESYRIISGPRAERAIEQSDGRLYHQGHVFGKGMDDGSRITIGYSSASKVWSNSNSQIPVLVEWCDQLAKRIMDDKPMPVTPGLEFLTVGEEVDALPDNIIAALWNETAFKQHITVSYMQADGTETTAELTDLDLVVDRKESAVDRVRVTVRGEGLAYPIDFSFSSNRFFEPGDPNHADVRVHRGLHDSTLIDYVNNNPLNFFCADFSHLSCNDLIRANADGILVFDAKRIDGIDWLGNNVDIQREFWPGGTSPNGKVSIHEHLVVRLNTPEHDVVVYDHGTGEIADVVTFARVEGRLLVRLYHGKGSGGPKPGDRVDDVYEVCGQVVKCLIWVEDEAALRKAILSRIDGGSKFIKGNLDELKKLLDFGRASGFRYQIAIVQPGISKSEFTPKLANVVAAADDYVRRGGAERLLVLASP